MRENNLPPGVLGIHKATILLPGLKEGIERDAFLDCTALEAIQLPCSVKTIGQFAFRGCTSLKIANVPTLVKVFANLLEGVECIEGRSFQRSTALKDIKLPRSVKEI